MSSPSLGLPWGTLEKPLPIKINYEQKLFKLTFQFHGVWANWFDTSRKDCCCCQSSPEITPQLCPAVSLSFWVPYNSTTQKGLSCWKQNLLFYSPGMMIFSMALSFILGLHWGGGWSYLRESKPHSSREGNEQSNETQTTFEITL